MKKRLSQLSFGALLLAVSALLSRVLGVVRDMVIAYVFGAGDAQLDAYFAAFKLPDLVFTLLITGAMSAAFVPVYTQLKQRSQKEASVFASQTIRLISLLLICALIIIWVIAPYFVPKIIVPGFSPETQELTVSLTRIMLLSPFFMGLSSIFQGIENSHKTFWGIALAPLVYNLSLIIGAYFFGPEYGANALAISVVVGALLHFLVQVPGVLTTSFKYELDYSVMSKSVREFISLAVPRIFGVGLIQVNMIIDVFLASLMAVGSLSIYNYSLNLQSLPYGVVAVSVSIAIFASLSELKEQRNEFIDTLSRSLNAIVYWTLPAVLGLFFLREQVVEVLLLRGAFDQLALEKTSFMLGVFVWAAIGQGIAPLFARAFFALKDTKTPVYTALIAGSLQLILNLLFVFHYEFSVWSLALSSTIAWTVNALLLTRQMGIRLETPIHSFFSRVSSMSLVHVIIMGLVLHMLNQIYIANLYLDLIISIGCGAGVYLGLHQLTKTTPRAL